MKKKIIFQSLIIVGLLNSLILIACALTGGNYYVLANNLSDLNRNLILLYIPISLTSIALLWYLIDLITKPITKINYLAIAFSGLLADAIYVIGSILFASGH